MVFSVGSTVILDPGQVKKVLDANANSKDSDQPAHLCSLIRVFATAQIMYGPKGNDVHEINSPDRVHGLSWLVLGLTAL